MLSFFCKYFYQKIPIINLYRRLSQFPAKCDICDIPVNFGDYPYMCRFHAAMYYESNWKFFPKFILRLFLEHLDIMKSCRNCSYLTVRPIDGKSKFHCNRWGEVRGYCDEYKYKQ